MLEFEVTWGGQEIEDVLVTTSGVVDPEGVAAYWQAIVDDRRLRPGSLVLIDHRATSWSEMSAPDIQRRARAFGGDLLERAQAAAIAAVMSPGVDFGLGRRAVVHAEGATNRCL